MSASASALNRTQSMLRHSTPANPAAATPPVDSVKNYSVDVEESEQRTVCMVTFNSLPSTSEVAAGVLREEMEKLIENNSNREILGMAFDEKGDALPDRQYGGPLIYRPHLGRILTEQEDNGLETTKADRGSYFVETTEGKTARGISPERRWYYVSIVFPSMPSLDEARAASVAEIDRLKSRGQDVNVFVFEGDKAKENSWKQLMGPFGKFLVLEYDAATKETYANWEEANFLNVETVLHEGMSREEVDAALGAQGERTMRMGAKESYRWQLSDGRFVMGSFQNGALAGWECRIPAPPKPDRVDEPEPKKTGVTLADFEAITIGTAYDKVVERLGSPGVLTGEEGIWRTYEWKGEEPLTLISVVFKGRRIVTKTDPRGNPLSFYYRYQVDSKYQIGLE